MIRTTAKKGANKTSPAKDVDAYLAALPADARVALAKLRRQIWATAPRADEAFSYGIPVFKNQGVLVGYAAFENHCSFFVMGTAVMNAHREELKPYDTAKATIRFPAGRPLPAAFITKLVKARIVENEARRPSKPRPGRRAAPPRR